MLSTIKELQDILTQRWVLNEQPDVDEEGGPLPDQEYVGEIFTHLTGDHVCYTDTGVQGKALAELLVASRNLYEQMRGVDNSDDYVAPGQEADTFLRALEEFVNKNAGW